ncbi:MAG: transglycosylase domain-containing protein [Clostridia bacterium]|nr:transglycosylase domain-containing protein [Clostridia bacterium]
MWRVAVALAGALVLVATWVVLVFYQTYEPKVAELPDIVRQETALHGGTYVALDQVAEPMRAAVVAAEDRTFYTNPGVSWRGIARALLVDVASLEYVEGGSTITQQLARAALLTSEKTLGRKLRELALAILITRRFSKDAILEMYLNAVYFGHGAWGVEAAAETYFAKPAASLTLAQSALLAGILQAPSRYDPLCHLEDARVRQLYVLEQMVEMRAATPAEREKALAQPLFLVPAGCGTAAYPAGPAASAAGGRSSARGVTDVVRWWS